MAQVSVTTTTAGSADANQTDVAGHAHGAGDGLLLVGVVLEVTDATKEVLSVAWDPGGANEALTRFASFSPSHSKLRIEIWRGLNAGITAQTATLRVTIKGGNSQKTGVVVQSLANVDQTTPLSGVATQDGTEFSGSVSVTQDADDLAMAIVGHFATGALAPGGGETELADFTAAGAFRVGCYSEDGSGGTTLSWSAGDSKERATLGFVVEASGGATEKTATTSLEATIQRQKTLIASLSGAVQNEITGTASADAAVAALTTETADLQAVVRAMVTRTLGLRAAVQTTSTRTASLHAGIGRAMPLTASIDSAIALVEAAAASADAALQNDQIASALTDAALRAEMQRQAGLAAALMLVRAGAANLEAALRKTETRSAGLDASISAASLRTIAASLSAALALARNISAQADAALAGTMLLGAGLDASLDPFYAPAGTRTFGHSEDRGQAIASGGRTIGHAEDRDQAVTAGGRTFVVPAGNRKH